MKHTILSLLMLAATLTFAQQKFDGLDMSMSNLSRLSDAKTRSISPENFTGEKGKGGMADPVKNKGQRNIANAANEARDLGTGWKVNPFIIINANETFTLQKWKALALSSIYG